MRGLSVLVVDDSALIRGLLSEAVRVSDVPTDDVLEARDGGEALEILRGRHIDVVITDLQMPRVDGFELIARIAANPDLAHVRIVTMTAAGHSLRAARMNVYARLIKPVRFDTIQTILGDIWRSLGSP